MKDNAIDPALLTEPLWDTERTATEVCMNPKTLENQRSKGIGIPYVKIGRNVRYVPAVVREHLASRVIFPKR